MKTLPRCLIVFLLALTSLTRLRANENAVLYWNEVAIDGTRTGRSAPPLAALYYATLHVAIFDSVNGITRADHGWLVNDPAPAGADMDAAIAGSAFTVLKTLWATSNPHQFFVAYDRALARIPDGRAKTDGIAWGKKVALAVLANRANSGFDKPIPGKYSSNDVGKWRETPYQFRPALLPYWGHVRPFVMTSQSQFRAPPPESLGSREYAEELAFTARHGARDNADRTEYQTDCTPFWSDDLGTGTPAGHWNMVAQTIARRKHLSEPESARLFALLNLAEADAGIACWETKYYYNEWRPETALRELDPKLNPNIVNQPDFIPNMQSPPFPTYTSGHSTFSSAGARMIALFFGSDDIRFSVGSDGMPGVVHTFKKLSDATYEAGMSRVWGGIHTMSDNIEAQKMGRKVSDWVYAHALLPVSG